MVTKEISKDVALELPSGKLTTREKRLARVWATAPWLALAGVTVAPPAALLLGYLLSGFSPLFLLLAITSAPVSLIIAIVVMLFLLMYRRRWTRQLRERLASDGITADEVGFFLNELTSGEKRSLRVPAASCCRWNGESTGHDIWMRPTPRYCLMSCPEIGPGSRA